jgi:hypothetical protein
MVTQDILDVANDIVNTLPDAYTPRVLKGRVEKLNLGVKEWETEVYQAVYNILDQNKNKTLGTLKYEKEAAINGCLGKKIVQDLGSKIAEVDVQHSFVIANYLINKARNSSKKDKLRYLKMALNIEHQAIEARSSFPGAKFALASCGYLHKQF